MNIVLYTTHCPRCNVLVDKLKEAGLSFEISENVDEMIDAGLYSAPALKIDDGPLMNFTEAIHWVKEQNAI